MNTSWDVIVVGGGPAGLSAALMLGRARRRVLVVDSGLPRNRFAAHMHGVLGHEGIDPRELLRTGRGEAAGYGVEFADGIVSRVDEATEGLMVTTTDGASRFTRAVIIASGMTDLLPDIPGLAQRWGTGVLHCPYCHGWEVRDRRLGVLATSPAQLHLVEMLRQWSDRVILFSAALEPLDPAVDRRLRSRGIEIVTAAVVEVLGEPNSVTGVRTGDGAVVAVDAIFAAGTPQPHDDFLAHLGLDRTDNQFGSFLSVDPTGRTSHDRIWAVGNVTNPAANVPLSIGVASFTGAVVNAALTTDEFDTALRAAEARR